MIVLHPSGYQKLLSEDEKLLKLLSKLMLSLLISEGRGLYNVSVFSLSKSSLN